MTDHGYIRTRIVCIALCCARCSVLQPLDALRRTPGGLFLCVDGASCRARLFENARAA